MWTEIAGGDTGAGLQAENWEMVFYFFKMKGAEQVWTKHNVSISGAESLA